MNGAPIGVFDSGIGGLTVVKELRKLLPCEDIVYFGDSARVPYGSRPPAEIMQFMHQILRFLKEKKVKMGVVACNTMTSLGLEFVRRQYPFPLVGVNSGVRTALSVSRSKRIGVIATQATVASGRHGKAARIFDSGAAVYLQACPKLVPLIEAEKLKGRDVEEAVAEHMMLLKEAQVDSLILGCTHYPFVADVIADFMGAEVAIIDPAMVTALNVETALRKRGLLASERQGTMRFYLSGELNKAERMAALLFDEQLPPFESVSVEKY